MHLRFGYTFQACTPGRADLASLGCTEAQDDRVENPTCTRSFGRGSSLLPVCVHARRFDETVDFRPANVSALLSLPLFHPSIPAPHVPIALGITPSFIQVTHTVTTLSLSLTHTPARSTEQRNVRCIQQTKTRGGYVQATKLPAKQKYQRARVRPTPIEAGAQHRLGKSCQELLRRLSG